MLAARGLVRPTVVPRRFAFRHPIVRRAVYDSAPPGWRLAAHERLAAHLRARGVAPQALARHVEMCAQPGDEDAVALLTAAAQAIESRAPATAARWYDAALRLLPEDAAARRAPARPARAGGDRARCGRRARSQPDGAARGRRPAAARTRTPCERASSRSSR